jgi:hypothetical protein
VFGDLAVAFARVGHAFNLAAMCASVDVARRPAGLFAGESASKGGDHPEPFQPGALWKILGPDQDFSDSKMRTHFSALFAQSSLLADELWFPGFNCEK